MRKLKIFEHISLDGVIQVRGSGEDGDYPYGDWTAPYRSPAGRRQQVHEDERPTGGLLFAFCCDQGGAHRVRRSLHYSRRNGDI
jgi:hypothetical protein